SYVLCKPSAPTACCLLSLHDALPISSTWPLLTGLRSLVQPQDEVCIRPSVFFEMVHVVSPVRIRKSNPNGSTLRHLSAVARELRSEEHTSELQSRENLVCRLLLEKKK